METLKVGVDKIDWSQTDQSLNEYDRMCCRMLYYCLMDDARKIKNEMIGQEVINNQQEGN